MMNFDSNPSSITRLLALAALSGVIAGCTTSRPHDYGKRSDPENIRDCAAPCEVVIALPNDEHTPPDAVDSEYVRVRAGQEVTFKIDRRGNPSDQSAVVLSFNKPAFKGSHGRRLQTIALTPSAQGRKVTALTPADCPEPDAPEPMCEYYIINIGNEGRPRKHPWIIIDP